MTALKTTINDASVEDFLHSIENKTRRRDGLQLLAIYQELTGEKGKMWGTSIVGFGQYHYKSERSRQEGDWPLAAFSPRKQNLSLYFMPGFEAYHDLLAKLGNHKVSKGCLYINKLADVDMKILKQLIARDFKNSSEQLT